MKVLTWLGVFMGGGTLGINYQVYYSALSNDLSLSLNIYTYTHLYVKYVVIGQARLGL